MRQLATEFHQQSRGSAGARTLSAALRVQGVAVGRFLAGRLMKEARLFSSQCRKHRYRKADGESAIAANELDRQFADSTPFGHSAHADPDTCSTIIRTGSRSAATQGWHC
ncbi:IS3 family transposase [Pseudomonas sp. WS 5011]|nr:IS3 family transposase [Pseudomonas sp. WS 5011]